MNHYRWCSTGGGRISSRAICSRVRWHWSCWWWLRWCSIRLEIFATKSELYSHSVSQTMWFGRIFNTHWLDYHNDYPPNETKTHTHNFPYYFEKMNFRSLSLSHYMQNLWNENVWPRYFPNSSFLFLFLFLFVTLALWLMWRMATHAVITRRVRQMNKPPKPLPKIEMEERAMQQITRLYAEFNPPSSSTSSSPSYPSSAVSPSPPLFFHPPPPSRRNKNRHSCVDTRPVDIKFASSFWDIYP